jgi:hypothetical protein
MKSYRRLLITDGLEMKRAGVQTRPPHNDSALPLSSLISWLNFCMWILFAVRGSRAAVGLRSVAVSFRNGKACYKLEILGGRGFVTNYFICCRS